MMWYGILRPSLFSAHCASFMSRWPLLRGLHIRSCDRANDSYRKFIKKYKCFFFLKAMHTCVFIGKINDIYPLINWRSKRAIPGFFKIARVTSRAKIKPWSRELNPTHRRTLASTCQKSHSLRFLFENSYNMDSTSVSTLNAHYYAIKWAQNLCDFEDPTFLFLRT